MKNINLVFLFVVAALVGYHMCERKSLDSFEGFAAIDDARQAVREVYNADIDAIRNLSTVATKLQAGGLTHPGRLTVNSGADHLPILAQSNTDSHILLRTKNDGNKDSYLINRDGHHRIHMAGVGDVFGVNHDGHLYNEHHGDHVAHHIGKGANPYMTLSRSGQWGNSSWYMQNVHNDKPENSSFRIGKHDIGAKLEIGSDGYLNASGARLGTMNATTINATTMNVNAIRIGKLTLSDPGDGSLRISNANGWVDIGAKNDGWAHLYTDRPKFALNKQLTDVSGNPYKDYMKFNEKIRIGNSHRVDGGEGSLNNQWLTVHGGHKVGPWHHAPSRAVFWAERE